MRKLKLFIVNLAVCFLLPQLLLVGCSLIGFGIGAIEDSSSRDGGEVSITELRGMEIGSSITVFMRDSRRIEGDFLSVKEENADQYSKQYAAVLKDLGIEGHVPIPGDSVTFVYRSAPGSKQRGKFRGVDPGTMIVNQAGRRVFVSDLGELQADGGSQPDLSAFCGLVHERKLPFLTKNVLMKVKGDTTEVPFVDLVRVEVNEARNAKFVGLAMGAAIDAIVIIVLTKSVEESCHESCNNSGACRSTKGT
jgi:hypothetical protein